ncbi:MAG: ABC transporter ATP-binding protein [Deltaproteobacteria bacterium]|nr:ABC transporter ATP-binding protein [Deltaproteobacteria bacterium]
MSLSFSLKKSFEGFSLDAELSLGSELMVLFGPSGAGKSLLLKLLSGIVRPDEGVITVGTEPVFDSGRGVDVPIRKRRIGYLFQDYALFPHMTVFENIAYAMKGINPPYPPFSKGGVGGVVREFTSLMRLSGLEDRYPNALSGGQKQRTALARTLAAGPAVLLLDEPFSALDFQVREKLRQDLLNIHEVFPITTILVTHDLEEAFMLGVRLAVINNGRLEQVGKKEDVFYRPATRDVARFVGARNIFNGRVARVEESAVVIESPGLGDIMAAYPSYPPLDKGGIKGGLKPGSDVVFCIRPEEIPIIRQDRVILTHDGNVVEGVISSITGRGTSHILFVKVGAGDTFLKIEAPNFVARKLSLATGKRIRVLLKKESVWVIPG